MVWWVLYWCCLLLVFGVKRLLRVAAVNIHLFVDCCRLLLLLFEILLLPITLSRIALFATFQHNTPQPASLYLFSLQSCTSTAARRRRVC